MRSTGTPLRMTVSNLTSELQPALRSRHATTMPGWLACCASRKASALALRREVEPCGMTRACPARARRSAGGRSRGCGRRRKRRPRTSPKTRHRHRSMAKRGPRAALPNERAGERAASIPVSTTRTPRWPSPSRRTHPRRAHARSAQPQGRRATPGSRPAVLGDRGHERRDEGDSEQPSGAAAPSPPPAANRRRRAMLSAGSSCGLIRRSLPGRALRVDPERAGIPVVAVARATLSLCSASRHLHQRWRPRDPGPAGQEAIADRRAPREEWPLAFELAHTTRVRRGLRPAPWRPLPGTPRA